MTPDVVIPDAQAPPTRLPETYAPPLKILIVAPTLTPAGRVPAPVEFANELAIAGMTVLFAAAIGSSRAGLSRAVGYWPIDDTNQAPVKTAHELSRLVRHHQPDVVHAHGARAAVAAALAVRASHARCLRVMTHHSPALRRRPRWIVRLMLRRCADRYFAADASLKAELESLGVLTEHIQVEPIDPARADDFARDAIATYRRLIAPRDGAD